MIDSASLEVSQNWAVNTEIIKRARMKLEKAHLFMLVSVGRLFLISYL
jgi:hypothetical protein